MSEQLTREQLHELVWTKPLAAVASDLGLSPYWLTKKCRSLNIPTPAKGHWTKLAAGLNPKKPKLPPEITPLAETHPSQWPREITGLCDRAQALIGELTRLKPDYEGLQSLKDRHFPVVRVTHAMVEAAARLFHAILIAVEPRGVPFRKSRSKYEGGYFEKESDRLYLEISELLTPDPSVRSWEREKKQGSGILEVTLQAQRYGRGWKKTWSWKEEGGVRERVSAIATAVDDYYTEITKKKQEEAEKHRLELERWRIEEDVRKRREHAQALITAQNTRIENLLKGSEWARLHHVVLDFIGECEARWKSLGDISPDQQDWLSWAKSGADAWSPLSTGYPDPKTDGVFIPENFPYGGPIPPTRKFPRPPTMPEFQTEEKDPWGRPTRTPAPIWLTGPR